MCYSRLKTFSHLGMSIYAYRTYINEFVPRESPTPEMLGLNGTVPPSPPPSTYLSSNNWFFFLFLFFLFFQQSTRHRRQPVNQRKHQGLRQDPPGRHPFYLSFVRSDESPELSFTEFLPVTITEHNRTARVSSSHFQTVPFHDRDVPSMSRLTSRIGRERRVSVRDGCSPS